LIGGSGADTFSFRILEDSTYDYITDFVLGEDTLFLGNNVSIVDTVVGDDPESVVIANPSLLSNSRFQSDITLSIENPITGVTQFVVIVDAITSTQTAEMWDAYFAGL
jgi:hypothetical protein